MKADSYRFDGSEKCRLDKLATNSKTDGVDKEKILAKTAENLQKMAALQDAFYADGREGLIFVLQAMDAAGKDSTIKHVMSGLNPQGVQVTSFKQPNSEELKHDFLWRVNKALPARGSIAIFNRSYYEDVLVVECLALGMEAFKETIVKLLKEVLAEDGVIIHGVFERSDANERKKEGLPKVKGWIGEPYKTEVEIVENGVHYLVDVENGQKTGFFLDQKYNRLAMQRICKGSYKYKNSRIY